LWSVSRTSRTFKEILKRTYLSGNAAQVVVVCHNTVVARRLVVKHTMCMFKEIHPTQELFRRQLGNLYHDILPTQHCRSHIYVGLIVSQLISRVHIPRGVVECARGNGRTYVGKTGVVHLTIHLEMYVAVRAVEVNKRVAEQNYV